jgi:restriction system protein
MALLMESIPTFRMGGAELRACPACGWWSYWRQTCSPVYDRDTGRQRWSLYGAAAELRTFAPDDLSQGLAEVRQYLLARYDARFELHPRLFELTVADVFRDLGYDAEATAYSADGGIDVVLRGPDGRTTGVQVKRIRDSVEVEQIRALAGALLLSGHTRGVYVTTSGFRSGAATAARRLTELALPVTLLDAPRFLDILRIAQRPPYADYYEWRDLFGDPDESTIYDDEWA